MLSEVKFIQNIGRFETAKPTRDVTFGRCTLVFGENGWGKSTLADIFRSVTTNNPAILIGRTTLDADGPPKAVLRFGTQYAVFEDGAWNGVRPRIAVYDSAFVNDNVFSGDIVSIDHMRNQYGLVVGEEGVKLVRRIVELDSENRENNQVISAAESELKAVIRTIAPPAMALDDFIALGVHPDIDKAIAGQDAKVQRARRAAELKGASELALLPVPIETVKLRDLLCRTIDEIAKDALAKVRAHIAAHECEGSEAEVAHERWLQTGTAFVQTDNCPFCGQPLLERNLVDAYADFFSNAYKELGAEVKRARESLDRYSRGDFRQTISRLAEQNSGQLRYWSEAGKLDPPEIGDLDDVIARMENAAARLDVLFAAKQANLTDAVSGTEANDALAAWEAGRSEIGAINATIEDFLAAIKALKDSIDPAALPGLENELKLLHATKRRHEDDLAEPVARLREAGVKREEIAKEKGEVRKALDNYERAITTRLGTTINKYLKKLAAGFRIDYRAPDYRGGREPTASYNILIREVPISPRSAPGQLDKPSFRNTLSSGDKSTLALALFLAKVNADPNLGDTIVVLDDPFASLDEFRRSFTAIEIRELGRRALQIIVLSHEKYFLRDLWDKIDHDQVSSLALQTGAPGMTTIAPFDIEAETRPRHVTERMRLDEFIQGEPHNPSHIRTRLRTVCEHFYRSGDRALFPADSSLDQIIRALEAARTDHPYKAAVDQLRYINEYSRGDSHAAVQDDPSDETNIEELKEWCRRVLDLTRGI